MDMPNVDLYTLLHPPAQVEAAEDHSLDCRAILTAAKNGAKSIDGKSISYIVTHVPIEEGLKYFPKMEGLESIASVVKLEDDTSLLFFKYKNSKNRWDVVIEYLNENGMPIRMYYARGKIIDKPANVADPHDVIFSFYNNPEEASDKLDLDVPSDMPSCSEISLCFIPSKLYKLKTI